MPKQPSAPPGRRSGRFEIHQANHYQALVEIAIHALLRMSAGHDPEAVHDLRVSLRTQRVLLGLFPRNKKVVAARKQLGRAAKLTCQVRDSEVAQALAESLEKQSGVGKKLVAAWQAELAESQNQLLDKLHAVELDDALEDAEAVWLKALLRKKRKVLKDRARRHARKLGKALRAEADALDQAPTQERWQQVHLRVTRLRYWVEGFAELLTHRQRLRLQMLRALQLSLSGLHDLEMFDERFKDKPMPAKWKELFAEQQELARHRASSELAELRANW